MFSIVTMKIKHLSILFVPIILFLAGGCSNNETEKQALSLLAMKNHIIGDGDSGLEAYERMLKKKCNGAVLEICNQSSGTTEELQKCMLSHFQKHSNQCMLFLANTHLKYPPLSEDKVVAGISFPKGSILYMNRGYVSQAIVPKPWKFVNGSCNIGQVFFMHWESRAEDRLKVSSCQ
jgi:hypothetical protein